MASGLWFGGAVKKIEKFWDAGPGSVFIKCYGIGHKRLRSCGDRPEKCVMCAREHQASKYQCGVNGCSKGTEKLCVHIVPWCANCQGSHQANSAQYPSRQKAEVKAQKNKVAKKARLEVKATSAFGPNEKDEEIPTTSDQKMDTETEEWAKRPGKDNSLELEVEGIDHTQKF